MDLRKRSRFAVFLVLALLLAGCNLTGSDTPQPPADSQSGGGIATPDQSQSGGGISPPQETETPFLPQTNPTSISGQQLPEYISAVIRSGGSFKNESVTFTLVNFTVSADNTMVDTTVSGLGKDYTPVAGLGEPQIELPGGALFSPRNDKGSDSGGGSPGTESAHFEFPALPTGTTQVTLIIDNNWTGRAERWRIPVSIQP